MCKQDEGSDRVAQINEFNPELCKCDGTEYNNPACGGACNFSRIKGMREPKQHPEPGNSELPRLTSTCTRFGFKTKGTLSRQAFWFSIRNDLSGPESAYHMTVYRHQELRITGRLQCPNLQLIQFNIEWWWALLNMQEQTVVTLTRWEEMKHAGQIKSTFVNVELYWTGIIIFTEYFVQTHVLFELLTCCYLMKRDQFYWSRSRWALKKKILK